MTELYVAEICVSVMGEMPLQGFPCVILRLAGCNLRCSYCDTPQALEVDSSRHSLRSLDEIVEEVASQGPSLVLVTGGEPMYQAGTPAMIERLREVGMDVVLETNGSYDLTAVPEDVVRVVDVKSPGSGEGGSFLDSNLEQLDSNDCLKFIVRNREDYLWSVNFLEINGLREGGGGPGHASRAPGVLFSPACGEMEPERLVQWILEDRINVRLNLQLHKYLGLP